MIQQFIHTIAKEEIAKLTVEEFKGRIITILSKEEADKAVEYLRVFRSSVLIRRPVPALRKEQRYKISLMQISTDDHLFLVPLESYRYTGISGEIPEKQFDLKDRVIFTG